jgi:ABC-2 type transport system ATP-binding protein
VKRYGRFQALHGIDLEVSRGEVFGFIGPNGAGKTTLIRTMLDLIRPSEGEVRVFGLDSRRGARAIHARTGYVPGELGLWERLTARQALSHLAGLRGGAGADRFEALAERLRLHLDRPIRELSKGNKEKVGLVQALMHEPDLVVLDEPTSGLDPLIQHEVFSIVDGIRDAGRTVFFSSHHLSEVERIADRVGIVRDGRMAATDTVAELKRRATRRVEAAFREPVDPREFEGIEGVREARAAGRRLHLVVAGEIDGVVKALAAHPVLSLSTPEPDLEEIFLGLYRGEGSEPTGDPGDDRAP